MKLTLKELRTIIRPAYDNGVAAAQCAERPIDIHSWRAQYVKDALKAATDDE